MSPYIIWNIVDSCFNLIEHLLQKSKLQLSAMSDKADTGRLKKHEGVDESQPKTHELFLQLHQTEITKLTFNKKNLISWQKTFLKHVTLHSLIILLVKLDKVLIYINTSSGNTWNLVMTLVKTSAEGWTNYQMQ